MKKMYVRETLRDLRGSLGRFIAIVAIVALGSGFFGGIKATSVDMKLTADEYYRQGKLMDFRLVSTLGITDEDAAAIAGMEGVRSVMPSYRTDALTTKEGDANDSVLRLHSLGDGSVNALMVKEGRLPESIDEIVLLSGGDVGNGYALGERIRIDLEQDPDMADTLAVDEFTVVGVADSPLYLSIEKASSSKGSGSVSRYGFVLDEAFTMEAYTELYVTMDSDAFAFSEEYDELKAAMETRLEEAGTERCAVRYAKVKGEADEKLAEAEAEYRDGKGEAEARLKEAEAKIADGEKEVADGESKIANGEAALQEGREELAWQRKQYESTVASSESELTEGRQAISEGERVLSAGRTELDAKEAELGGQMRELETGLASVRNAREALEEKKVAAEAVLGGLTEQLAGLDASVSGLNDRIAALVGSAAPADQTLKAQLEVQRDGLLARRPELEKGVADAKAGLDQLERGLQDTAAQETELTGMRESLQNGLTILAEKRRDLEQQETLLTQKKAELAEGEKALKNAKTEAEGKLAKGEAELAKGEQELDEARIALEEGRAALLDAKAEYEDGKREADEELAKAEEELADARAAIADIPYPDWYVLDRSYGNGYTSFAQDADRIDAIASVFPVFFFLVAALVCLTTMTRMVEDQRTQIGVLKALGYTKGAIAEKYIFYALATSLMGSIIGLLVGFQVFPKVIWAAYGILYALPPIQTPFNLAYALIAALVFMACTLGATLAACYSELTGVPASLIRPKPPQSGKRVFLENVTFIWRRMSFTQKLTARNILRYKKRFFMTVIGIAGCMALMLTGFGLKDSIGGIVKNQFGELYHYDLSLSFKDALKMDDLTPAQQGTLEMLRAEPRLENTLLVHQEEMSATSENSGEMLNATIFVPEDGEGFPDFVTLQDRRSKEPIAFPESGVVLSEKLAHKLSLFPGDTLRLAQDNTVTDFTVAAVTENYVYHYVYMSPAQYEAGFGRPCAYQGMMAQMTGEGEAAENALSSDLLQSEEIVGVSFISFITENFTDIFERLDLVVGVLIISASLLAFVVLYNLTNINITERVREIATIKVLGFYDKEVSAYIYRENVVLTLIGILMGVGLGVLLHQFVVQVAEVNIVMFGREILPPSYLWAALLTLAFAGLVNFVMHFRLKRISMVESLKSIE